MNRYAVIACQAPQGFNLGNYTHHRGVGYLQPNNRDNSGEDFGGVYNKLVYYFDNKGVAEVWAMELAKENPGTEYGVVEVSTIYVSTPGPVKKLAMTDKGVLPA